jgi:hypothetical protein
MYVFYVIASSAGQAYENMFKGDHYGDRVEAATKDLERFGRNWESLYKIELPSPTVEISSQKLQRKLEKQNAPK